MRSENAARGKYQRSFYQDTLGTKNTTDIFVRSALTLEERLVLGAQGGVLLVAPDATDRVVQPVRRGRGALRLQENKKTSPFKN